MSAGIARLLANIALFQGAWFAAVLAPAGAAAALAALALALHFRFLALAGEWRFIALTTAIGGGMDSLFALAGVFVFAPGSGIGWQPPPAPLWLLLIWANFAATFCHSLRWLQQQRLLAFLLGAAVAPATYLGGVAISDKMTITLPPLQFFAVAAPCWALLCLALPQLARKLHPAP